MPARFCLPGLGQQLGVCEPIKDLAASFQVVAAEGSKIKAPRAPYQKLRVEPFLQRGNTIANLRGGNAQGPSCSRHASSVGGFDEGLNRFQEIHSQVFLDAVVGFAPLITSHAMD
ncbi:hypothetical protein CUJ84_pRLN4000080 (plasmid) [Rhizobium leguminosarum]|uniref:Uncharacterized protein n=1 Tax=Rhizobium leguminosarum TaxID=384 RepID=A0A2K9ZIC6_RHILE|nr:hypothetical protein CUJ84_pRLN4000080 [Rhizobium leguminosarum]